MKLRFLLLFSFLWLVNITVCQDCPSGILIFNNQTEIDNFLLDYPNCTQLEDDVRINGWTSNSSNLLGLQNITSIIGDLSIKSTHNLEDLSDLENLTFIGGGLRLSLIHI